MTPFKRFDRALDKFREAGGAMAFRSPLPSEHGKPTWFVGTFEEIAEVTDNNAKAATVQALLEGGLTETAANAELSAWRD